MPCAQAHIGVCDRIFTRIGASDNLAQGQSTFFVEMSELSYILNNAKARSLIILDEIDAAPVPMTGYPSRGRLVSISAMRTPTSGLCLQRTITS